MSTEVPKRIQLKGDRHYDEGVAAAIISPGMLVALDNAGKLVPHATQGVKASPSFAVEDALQGRTINDDYAVDELVFYVTQRPGDIVYARLADGEDVEIGDLLTSAGDGTLEALGGGDVPVAEALEAVDLSDSSNTESGFIRARIL